MLPFRLIPLDYTSSSSQIVTAVDYEFERIATAAYHRKLLAFALYVGWPLSLSEGIEATAGAKQLVDWRRETDCPNVARILIAQAVDD